MPGCYCPCCNHYLDAAASEQTLTPEPNDISICLKCTVFLTYTDDLSLRELTLEEIGNLEPDARAFLVNTRKKIEYFKAQEPETTPAHNLGINNPPPTK